ncbi:MAG: single-stranded DNA-binding protein [Desulfitibacter sp. BRH_c19]|nr:MAG: single-stranded DNA-binding protein [Desulfitibacter sp. BRH_c19]
MLNKVILIGRLTRDPELRYTGSGIPVANFSLAVDRPFANKQGERETDFIRIVVWRKLAEVCAKNLGKGRLVAVDGRIQINSYEAQDGSKRQATDVVAENVRFLDWPKDKVGASNDTNFGEELGIPDDSEFPF